MNKRRELTRKLVVSALLLSIAIIITRFRMHFNIAGAPVIRISFSGPFYKFAALLFGPLYGGLVPAIGDVVNYLINPMGAYLFPVTLVAFVKGFFIGFLWKKINNINFKIYNRVYLSIFILAGLIGLINLLMFNAFPQSEYSVFLSGIGSSFRMASVGFVVFSAVGLVIHAGAILILSKSSSKQKYSRHFEAYLKLAACVVIPSVIGSAVNTYIFKVFMLIPERAFILSLIPRVVESLVESLFNVYFLVFMLDLYKRSGMYKSYEESAAR